MSLAHGLHDSLVGGVFDALKKLSQHLLFCSCSCSYSYTRNSSTSARGRARRYETNFGQRGWCVCAGLFLVDLERGCLAQLRPNAHLEPSKLTNNS